MLCPTVHRPEGRGLDGSERGRLPFAAEHLDQAHGALAVLLGLNGLRVSRGCGSNVDDPRFDRGRRTFRIMSRGSKPAVIRIVPRTARTIDLAVGGRAEEPILCRAATGSPATPARFVVEHCGLVCIQPAPPASAVPATVRGGQEIASVSKTKRGTVLTPEIEEALAGEAEAGYDLANALHERAEEEHHSVSAAARDALRRYLAS